MTVNERSDLVAEQNEYPLYPPLLPGGAEAVQALVDAFKAELAKVAERTIGELYCGIGRYVESDAWTNFRNDLVAAMKDYPRAKASLPYDFKQIRATILQEHRAELIEDLNQDHLDKIAELERQIDDLRRWR